MVFPIIILLITIILSGYYSHCAFENLSEEGEKHEWLLMFLKGWAPERYFTEEGYRYIVKGRIIAFGGFFLFILASFFP
jgi:hypothetical protein